MALPHYSLLFEKKPKRQWVEYVQPSVPIISEEKQRAPKNMRTKENPIGPETSIFRRRLLAPNQKPPQMNSDQGRQFRNLNPSPNDIVVRQGNQISQSLQQQLQNYLPRELEIGPMVALNVDQNLYFNFNRRMAEKVVWFWVQNVMSGFEKMKIRGELGRSPKAWTTVIEVILDKDGTVVSTQPLQLAGDADMDNAPIRAFRQAKHFPNPPAEMAEEDGYIRIKYQFIVYYNPM